MARELVRFGPPAVLVGADSLKMDRCPRYVEAFEAATHGFEQVHGSLGKIPGIEYQTLLSRGAPAASGLFRALRSIAPRRIPGVPWHCIFASGLLAR